MKHKITFTEGYRLMRKVGVDCFASAFMAAVWVLRGDEVSE